MAAQALSWVGGSVLLLWPGVPSVAPILRTPILAAQTQRR